MITRHLLCSTALILLSISTMSRALVGKSFLVTGSTDGIGQHTAIRLYKEGANVLVHGRSEERVQRTVDQMKKESGGQVDGITSDISTLRGMHKLAEEVSSRWSTTEGLHLNIINNAGIFESTRRVTEDGIELVFATNVLAPYVLTGLLLPVLRAKSVKRPRVITCSSISQGYSKGLDDLQFEKPGSFSDHNSYSLSKLCDAMFSMELHERYGDSISSNCLDPGTVNTKMLIAGWGACGIGVNRANDEYYLATSEELEGVSGKYFVSRRESSANRVCYDAAARKKLWDYMADLSKVVY